MCTLDARTGHSSPTGALSNTPGQASTLDDSSRSLGQRRKWRSSGRLGALDVTLVAVGRHAASRVGVDHVPLRPTTRRLESAHSLPSATRDADGGQEIDLL